MTEDDSLSRRGVLAVLVLYKRAPEESEAFTSLRSILERRPEISGMMRLLVFDNSPQVQSVPELPIDTRYISDTGNAGLARAYNCALQMASEDSADWLLLLDQDTQLTEEYLVEVFSQTQSAEDRFEAIVPKLVEDGVVLSPHLAITMRHPKSVEIGAYGISAAQIHPYNSGAVLRVKALQEIGGFPESFWLDYLDHATFRRLQTCGGRIFIMRAALEHRLSSNHAGTSNDPIAHRRTVNVLRAEKAFYLNYGTPRELFYYRVRLIRRAWISARAGQFRISMLLLGTLLPQSRAKGASDSQEGSTLERP